MGVTLQNLYLCSTHMLKAVRNLLWICNYTYKVYIYMYDTWNIFRNVHNFNGYSLVWIIEYKVFKISFLKCVLLFVGKMTDALSGCPHLLPADTCLTGRQHRLPQIQLVKCSVPVEGQGIASLYKHEVYCFLIWSGPLLVSVLVTWHKPELSGKRSFNLENFIRIDL